MVRFIKKGMHVSLVERAITVVITAPPLVVLPWARWAEILGKAN
jgi:hypothetical protein